jgi:hypothetical protein
MSYKEEDLRCDWEQEYVKPVSSDKIILTAYELRQIIEKVRSEALNAEKAHCTDDPLECPALKRFADAEKTGKFTCACCGVELLPQGEWSLCFNCEKMNADRLHPEAEKAERCPDTPEEFCNTCRWKIWKNNGDCKPCHAYEKKFGKLSTSGEDDLVLLIVKEMYGIPYSKLAIGEAEKCKKLAHAIMEGMK